MSKKIKNRSPLKRGDMSLSTNDHKPIFSLENILKDHCLSLCEKNEKAAFADTLLKLSRYTWGELQQSGRHQKGHEKINYQSLYDKLPFNAKDVQLLAFRFDGMKAMIGYRMSQVFYLIALDRDFTAYKH